MTKFFGAITDSAGLITVSVLMAGCLHVPGPSLELRAFVAACGSYALADAAPAPKPKPAVCRTCGGRGILGDGRVAVPCPDCTKKAGGPPCTGTNCIVR